MKALREIRDQKQYNLKTTMPEAFGIFQKCTNIKQHYA